MKEQILDDTDWAIITILSEENTTNNAIADELGITEGTVRQRIKRLRSAGVLKIKALIDPETLANKQLIHILANVSESHLLDKKAKEISELEGVLSVSLMAGQYDLMIELLVDSNKGLMHFITETLSTVEGIAKSETLITLKSYNKYI